MNDKLVTKRLSREWILGGKVGNRSSGGGVQRRLPPPRLYLVLFLSVRFSASKNAFSLARKLIRTLHASPCLRASPHRKTMPNKSTYWTPLDCVFVNDSSFFLSAYFRLLSRFLLTTSMNRCLLPVPHKVFPDFCLFLCSPVFVANRSLSVECSCVAMNNWCCCLFRLGNNWCFVYLHLELLLSETKAFGRRH